MQLFEDELPQSHVQLEYFSGDSVLLARSENISVTLGGTEGHHPLGEDSHATVTITMPCARTLVPSTH